MTPPPRVGALIATRARPSRRVEPIVLLLGAITVLSSLITESARLDLAVRDHSSVLAAFAVAIVVGEQFRVQMPSGRVAAPVSTASAIALAVLGSVEGHPVFDVPAGIVAIVVAGSLCVGTLVGRVLHRRTHWYVVAARTVGVGVTASLMRAVPLDGGAGEWAWQLDDGRPPWLVAVVMMGAAAAGLYVEIILTGLVRAQRRSLPVASALSEELGEAQALTLGLLAAGPLVAFLAPVVGLAALPLGLLPMVLTYVAVRRYTTNRATYRQTIATLSQLTEVAGYTPTGHASRVASRSVSIARSMGMHAEQVQDLEYAALLHDLGQVGLRSPIPDGATVLAAPDDQRRIASEGARIVRRTEVLDRVADLMEGQTTPFRHVREWNEKVPIESRIIKVANAFDDFSHGRTDASSIEAALERIHLGLGYEYDPEVVEALIRTVHQPSHT
ncbi:MULTISPECIES: HD-GYP domain-containing protein [unclassified Knoellia]|uniref:HD-GYP domain-containing protein n=1 Tax=Knoellia altitudinis TaxID=3404795 RepID=UPI0036227549